MSKINFDLLPGLGTAIQKVTPLESRTIQTTEQLNEFLGHLSRATHIALDTETTGLHIKKLQLVGLSFAFNETEGWYIPVGHTAMDRQLPTHVILEALKPYLEDPAKTFIFHHSKFDLAVLNKYNIFPPYVLERDRRTIEDTMIAAWLLDENQRLSLKKLAFKHLGMQMTTYAALFSSASKKEEKETDEADQWDSEKIQAIESDPDDEGKTIHHLPVRIAAEYAKDDAIATFRLYNKFMRDLEAQDLMFQYYFEMKIIPAMVHMNTVGVMIDIDKAEQKYQEASEEIAAIEAEIKEILVSMPAVVDHITPKRLKLAKKKQDKVTLYELINLNSNPFKKVIFYDILKLANDKTKKTKTGAYSTGRWALQSLERRGKYDGATENEVIGGRLASLMLKLVKKTKLVQAFFAPLATQIIDGRVYGSFNNIGTRTGRFSCQVPNLQQCPRDTKADKEKGVPGYSFREIFIAPPGYKWVCVDMSQIEMRISAFYSQDKTLMEAYLTGQDIHIRTAITMSGMTEEQFYALPKEQQGEMRQSAKPIGFGIIYGMSGPKLYDTRVNEYGIDEFSISPQSCQKDIDRYLDVIPGIREFMRRQYAMAEQFGYIRTLIGRKRRLPNTVKPVRPPRGSGTEAYLQWKELDRKYHSNCRIAVNSTVQGSSADLLKYIIVRIFDEMEEGRWDIGDRKCKMLSQVHDELNFECAEEISDQFCERVKEIMAESGVKFKLNLPILGEGHTGVNWSSAKA